MRASGMPKRTVRKILTTSPMLDETAQKKQRLVVSGLRGSAKGRTEVANKLFSIIVNKTTFLYGLFYRRKVRVGEDHVGREFRNVGSAAHSDTNVCLLQRRSVIHTVSSLKDTESVHCC